MYMISFKQNDEKNIINNEIICKWILNNLNQSLIWFY